MSFTCNAVLWNTSSATTNQVSDFSGFPKKASLAKIGRKLERLHLSCPSSLRNGPTVVWQSIVFYIMQSISVFPQPRCFTTSFPTAKILKLSSQTGLDLEKKSTVSWTLFLKFSFLALGFSCYTCQWSHVQSVTSSKDRVSNAKLAILHQFDCLTGV